MLEKTKINWKKSNYSLLKSSFLEARRLKCHKDMLVLGELLYSLNSHPNLESTRYVAEAYYSNKFFLKATNFLEMHSEFTYNDQQLMLIHANSLISLGNRKIKEALRFLKYVSHKWDNESHWDLLKILLGQAYEMNYLGKEALEVYKGIFLMRPIYTNIIKKLFGCSSLTLEEELSLLRNATFREQDQWAIHMCRGLIESTRGINIQNDFPIESPSSNCFNVNFDASSLILFQAPGRLITLKDTITTIISRYPLTHLEMPFKFCKLSLRIQAQKAYNDADYPLCFSICQILLDTVLANFMDVLPFYTCSCVILGLSAELKKLTYRLIEENSERDTILFTMGCSFLLKADYHSSIRCFKESSDTCYQLFNSVYYSSQIALGHALSLIGATDQALRAYLLASILFSGDHNAKLFMGMEQIKQNSHGEALNSLNQAKSIAPRNPAVLHELATIHLYLHKYNRATEYSKMAIKLTSSNPFLFSDIYLSTLGKIYLTRFLHEHSRNSSKRKFFIKALNTLRLACKANLGNSEAHSYLGICFFFMGISLQAYQHLFWSSYFNNSNHIVKVMQQMAVKRLQDSSWMVQNTEGHNIFTFNGFKLETSTVSNKGDEVVQKKLESNSSRPNTNSNFGFDKNFNLKEEDLKIDPFLHYIGTSLNNQTEELEDLEYIDARVNMAKSQIDEAIKQLFQREK